MHKFWSKIEKSKQAIGSGNKKFSVSSKQIVVLLTLAKSPAIERYINIIAKN
jgi:hypothetical protein